MNRSIGRFMLISTGIHVLLILIFLVFRGRTSSISPIIIDFSIEKTPFDSMAAVETLHSKKVPVKHRIQLASADLHELFSDTVNPDTIALAKEMLDEIQSGDSVQVAAAGSIYGDSAVGINGRYVKAPYSEVFAAAELDMPLECLGCSDPDYPPLALRAGIEGIVVSEYIVGKNGCVERCDIIKVEGHRGFADKVRDAVIMWCFKVPRVNGDSVMVKVTQVFRFDL